MNVMSKTWYVPEEGKSFSEESALLFLLGGSGCLGGIGWKFTEIELAKGGETGAGGGTVGGKVRRGVGDAPIGGGMVEEVKGLGRWRGVTLVPSTTTGVAIVDFTIGLIDVLLKTSLSIGGVTSWSSTGVGDFCDQQMIFTMKWICRD